MNCMESTLERIEKIPLLNKDEELNLSYLQRIAYGFGHVFNDLCAAMWFSYLLFYLQIILQMKATIAGTLLMIGQVFDALATPVAGWAVDKYGTKKLWHLIGTSMVAISFPLVYTKCFFCFEDNEIQQLFYHILVIVLFQIGWAIVQISHLSIIPNITNVPAQRSELTAIRYTASVCSSVAAYIVTWIVLRSQSQVDTVIGPSDYPKFREIVIVILSMGAISTLIFYCGIDWNKCNMKTSNANSLLNMPKKNVFLSPILYQISSLYVASRLFMTLNLVYMPLYLEEQAAINADIGTNNIREYLASVPLVSFVASFITSIVLKYKTDLWGNKNTYLFGSIISLSSCLWIGFYIPQTSNIFFVYIVAVLIGTGSSITIVSSLCLTAEMIGPNVDQGASVYSIVTFTDKLICGLAVVIIEHMKCADKSLCPEYYRYVLANMSGAAALFGILTLGILKLCQRHRTSSLHT